MGLRSVHLQAAECSLWLPSLLECNISETQVKFYDYDMSSLLRVRVSSFLAGIAVAGTAALVWLRDDVRHSFQTLHTHVSPRGSFPSPPLCP